MTSEIERQMHEWHQDTKESAQIEIHKYESEKAKQRELEAEKELAHKMALEHALEDNVPFCKIIEVKIGSPADKGGLQVGDLIVNYGKVNYLNHNDLKHMVDLTREFINQPIEISLLRKGVKIEKDIVPGAWDGPGVLGCRFDKIEN